MDFEQWQTASDILTKFIDPMYKRCLEYLNGLIAAHITNAFFNINAPINGATAGEVTVGDAAAAWDALADAKCPVDDVGDLSLFTHNNVHHKMLMDTAWTQESLVGAMIAQRARETGNLGQAFNFQKRWDQQAPKVVGTPNTYTCLAAHKYAMALALRPLELINDGTTQSRLIMIKGIPLRVMISYQHLKGGRLLTVDTGAAAGVIRPEFGVIIHC